MSTPFEHLLDGNFTQMYNSLYQDRLDIMWPALPFVAILISVRIATKSDAATFFCSVFGIIAMAAADHYVDVSIHPAVYGIAVLSLAMLFYRAFYK